MDRRFALAQHAWRLRQAWESIVPVSDAAVEQGNGELASKLCDVELELMQLHGELLELPLQPRPTPLFEYGPDGPQEIPF